MTRADRLLVAGLVCVALAATPVASAREAGAAKGTAVVVKHPGGVVRMPADHDDTLAVRGLRGRVVVVVQDGAARVVESSCRDQICVRSGRIASPGEAIACVPNGVVVTIEGAGGDELDALIR